MCPDNPELQYRAEFPVHFRKLISFICPDFSGQMKESVQEILPYTAFPGNFKRGTPLWLHSPMQY